MKKRGAMKAPSQESSSSSSSMASFFGGLKSLFGSNSAAKAPAERSKKKASARQEATFDRDVMSSMKSAYSA